MCVDGLFIEVSEAGITNVDQSSGSSLVDRKMMSICAGFIPSRVDILDNKRVADVICWPAYLMVIFLSTISRSQLLSLMVAIRSCLKYSLANKKENTIR